MTWESIRDFFATLSLERLLPAVLILVLGYLLVRLLLRLFDRALNRSRLDKTMFTFLKTIVRALLYAIVVLIAASSLGIDVTSLVAVLSVISLAISLAVQNTLGNVVGSITLLTTHPFRVGDYVSLAATRARLRKSPSATPSFSRRMAAASISPTATPQPRESATIPLRVSGVWICASRPPMPIRPSRCAAHCLRRRRGSPCCRRRRQR